MANKRYEFDEWDKKLLRNVKTTIEMIYDSNYGEPHAKSVTNRLEAIRWMVDEMLEEEEHE